MTHLSVGAVFIALLGGLASFFSPCVAPLAPGYISYISSLTLNDGEVSLAGADRVAGAAGGTWRARLFGPATIASVLFVAGFSVAFIALGFLMGGFATLVVPIAR